MTDFGIGSTRGRFSIRRDAPGDTADLMRDGLRVPRFTALLVIAAGYLLCFADAIMNAVLVVTGKATAKAVDYGSAVGLSLSAANAGQIAGACLLLWLVLKWLGAPPSAAGIGGAPRWRQTCATAYVAVAGLSIAQLVITLLRDPDAASTNQPVVLNAWTAFGFLDALRAGVTEEVIIVAIPVLVGLRAGWSRPMIIALSMAMRWPFHIYHGFLNSIPWTIIWGGAFAAAFLTWGRLLPLIAAHTWWDARGVGTTLWGGEVGTLVVDGAGLAALLAVMTSWYLQRRRLLNPHEPKVTDPGPFALLRRRMPQDASICLLLLVLAAAMTALYVDMIAAVSRSFGSLLAISFAGWILVLAALLTVSWTSNAWVYHDASGTPIGMLLWHTDGNGTIWVDSRAGDQPLDLLVELTALATHLGQNITVPGRVSKMGRRLVQSGQPLVSAGLTARVVVRPSDAHARAT